MSTHFSPELIANKVLPDDFYGPLYRAYASDETLHQAGYFDDGFGPNTIHGDTKWLCTPIQKIYENLAENNRIAKADSRPAVLLTTGAFSPIHQGHIEMMELAKKGLEQTGIFVAGGYFAPGHDSYVSVKKNGEAALPAPHRNYLAELALSSSDWLMNDNWADMYVEGELNYTDVVARLETYLAAYIEQPLDVYYVFGGDNSGFARAFLERGHGICIARPGYEEQFRAVKHDQLVQNSGRVLFVDVPHANDISSNQVRSGQSKFVPSAARAVYKKWQETPLPAQNKQIYALRNDLDWAIQDWQLDLAVSSEFSNEFLARLKNIISDAFTTTTLPDTSFPIEIQCYDLRDQQAELDGLVKDQKVLNLDACVGGGHRLELSRWFDVSDTQLKPRGLMARLGRVAAEEQLALLPPGNYLYVDDDIATGATLDYVRRLLPDNKNISDVHTLLKSSDLPIYDVVDARDFLVGAKDGGLMVRLPSGEYARAPYLAPYVSLATRAKIPLSTAKETSKQLWELNLWGFENFMPSMTLRQINQPTQILFEYLGFSINTNMQELCKWHLDQLN